MLKFYHEDNAKWKKSLQAGVTIQIYPQFDHKYSVNVLYLCNTINYEQWKYCDRLITRWCYNYQLDNIVLTLFQITMGFSSQCQASLQKGGKENFWRENLTGSKRRSVDA
jgi:hypothetical protein